MTAQQTSTKRPCILHIGIQSSNEPPKTSDDRKYDKVKTVDTFRRQITCYNIFTAVPTHALYLDVQTKEHTLRSDVCLQTTSSGIFPPVKQLALGKASMKQHWY